MQSVMLHEQQRQRLLRKVEKQIQGLQNEMEFVEILVQFWPWPNMALKMERMEQKMRLLQQQRQQYLPDKEVANVRANSSGGMFFAPSAGLFKFPDYAPT